MPRISHTLRAGRAVPSFTKLSARTETWVNARLREMTLEEKIGQLVMIPFFGAFTSQEDMEFQKLARLVTEYHIGGLVVHTRRGPLGLERSRAYPTAALANMLQRLAKVPLFIAGDFERGTVYRLEDGTSFPHSMAVAATGRLEDAYTVGRITALEARAAGANWVFAPVADVNSDPENPIINMRSFGEAPQRVAEWVAEYVRGVEENGALATAKHFPGHGATHVDSHLAMPTIQSSREHLETVELVPFQAAIAAGVSTIMTGHLAVPALEPEPNMPTTLSEKITRGLLRQEMRFEGLIVTDDLQMGGIRDHYAYGETATRAILAGSDVLLVFDGARAVLAGLRNAAENGRLSISCIDEAVTRILRAKAGLGLHKNARVDLDDLPKSFGLPEFQRAAADIADRGITLLRDTPRLLPLDATRPARALLVAMAGDPDLLPGLDFERELRRRFDTLQVVRADSRFKGIAEAKLPPSDSYDLTVVALFVRVTNDKETIGLAKTQAEFVRDLLATNKPVIVACFGSPYLVAAFPEAKTWLAAFSTADVAQRALARAMFGQIAIGGRIPVNVPGAVAIGAGLDVAADPMTLPAAGSTNAAQLTMKLSAAYSLLDHAVADHAFPGGVVAIGHCGEFTVHAFGKHGYDVESAAVTAGTIYDVASLTKAVVTTTLSAMLVEEGQLDVDAPISRYVPEWAFPMGETHRDWRSCVTLRHLLTHTSGLPAHQNYFQTLKTRSEIISAALAEPLMSAPVTQSVYSDVGFIIAGEIIERVTGRPLDELASERIFAPLGMADTMFRPAEPLRTRIAPTEQDGGFRGRLIHGEVHDENAWIAGGVAGHAGMFSTAGDLAVFCQMLLNSGIYAHRRLLRRATVAQFTAAEEIARFTRTMGWMAPTPDSSSGRYFSARSFGHTGFTGASMWIDPEKQLFVVLLTNRVHPTRENEHIKKVRPALHDAIVEALRIAGTRTE